MNRRHFLSALPLLAVQEPKPVQSRDTTIVAGESLYRTWCSHSGARGGAGHYLVRAHGEDPTDESAKKSYVPVEWCAQCLTLFIVLPQK